MQYQTGSQREARTMDRLTAREPHKSMAYLTKVKTDEQEIEASRNTCLCIMESWERLAAYEDTGMTPEEVAKLAEGKALYEAYDGSKLDRADQYIGRLEKELEHWKRAAQQAVQRINEMEAEE
jgi:uncharacterized protein YdbL (DUF1318 family)